MNSMRISQNKDEEFVTLTVVEEAVVDDDAEPIRCKIKSIVSKMHLSESKAKANQEAAEE